MKTTIIFSIFLLATISLFAKKVEVETALKVAKNTYYFYQPADKALSQVNASLAFTFSKNNTPLIYAFNINQNDGWVLVSADDIAKPIIGYSFEGTFPTGKLIPSFESWMQQYQDQISFGIENNIAASSEITSEWTELITVQNPKRKDIQMTQPLLLTTWNQDSPYNASCPVDAAGDGGHVYVGCVALAMAQAIKYYNYPAVGQGTHTNYSSNNGGYGNLTVNYAQRNYDWTNMPLSLTTTSSSDIADFLYDCSVAVDMMYGPDGSGSYTNRVVTALVSNYKYSNSASLKNRTTYTTTNWKNLLKAQIDSKYPMVYSGSDSDGGHAWNCDGYSGEEFHMNWGWGGSANGFYEIDNLIAGGYEFTLNHQVVINIFPTSGYPENCSITPKMISGIEGNFNDGSGFDNYGNNKDCLYLIQPTCGQSVKLNFDLVSLSTGDTIFVYAGSSTSDNLLATYYQGNTPLITDFLNSLNGAMLIRFKTDGTGTAEGWYASYKVAYCTGTVQLTDLSAEFGDGSGICEYNSLANCTWELMPSNVDQFVFNFSEFNLPSTDTNDYVLIYKNTTSSSNLVAKYHGLNIPTQLTVNAPKTYVKFKSNATVVGGGFTLTYNALFTNYSNSNIDLYSASIFPNPSNETSTLLISSNKGQVIEIQISDITGKILQTQLINATSGNNNLPLSVDSKGIYLITILSENEKMVLKYIKN